MNNNQFVETQKFNQKLLWMTIAFLILAPIILAIFIKKGVLISILIAIPVIVLLLLLRLKTTVDKEGIGVKFFPIIIADRNIKWEEIEKIYVRKYKPITEYGGWGLRMTFDKGVAYTVKGNYGVQIVLKNQKKILIGTQKKSEIEQAINTFFNDGSIEK